VSASVRFDDEEMQAYLAGLDEPGVDRILRKGVNAGAAPLRNAVRSEVPVKRAGGMRGAGYGQPGEMRAAVRAKRIRQPDVVGVVVGPMGRKAFMRHWVARGTRAHTIAAKRGGFLALGFGFVRVVHHPGAHANDYIGRAMGRAEGQAVDKAEAKIIAEATK
jgi:hypothetical protein